MEICEKHWSFYRYLLFWYEFSLLFIPNFDCTFILSLMGNTFFMGTIEGTVNIMEKQMKFQKNRDKSHGENKCSIVTKWPMRLRLHVREDVTSLSLGRNIKMVPSVLKTGVEEKQIAKASTWYRGWLESSGW